THPMLAQEVLNQHHTDSVKLTFVLFDEIEKASDALWNLLLGILDKATLTLGDNRKVDFSKALIFMTSNIGAAEMSSLISPKLGFHVSTPDDSNCAPTLTAKLSRTGIEAARRKFTPEFLNRLDRIVVFEARGNEELNVSAQESDERPGFIGFSVNAVPGLCHPKAAQISWEPTVIG